MNTYWQSREPREKVLILIALSLLLALLLWQFVLRPLHVYPAEQYAATQRAQRTLAAIETINISAPKDTLSDTVQYSAEDARAFITQSALKDGLRITRRQPDGDVAMTVWLDQADPRGFYSWIRAVTQGTNIEVQTVNLSRNSDIGLRTQILFSFGEKT